VILREPAQADGLCAHAFREGVVMPTLNYEHATSTSAPAQSAPAPRLLSLDAARFIAALGVIWIHAAAFVQLKIADDSGFIGRFAVPFFVFTGVLYAAGTGIRQPQRTLARYVLDRLLRLYVPFLVWTILYLVFKQLQNVVAHGNDSFSIGPSVLWDGGSYHLWFLPFICVTTIVAFVLGKVQSKRSSMMISVIALSWIGGVVFALAPRPFAHSQTLVLRFGWDALPAALWATGLASLQTMKPRLQFRGTIWFIAGICLTISCTASLCIPGPHILLANLAGVGWALVGFSDIRSRAVTQLHRLGSLAYGVYLFHIMPMGVLRSQAPKFLHLPIATISFAVVATVLVTISSIIASVVLSHFHFTAWLVPGSTPRGHRPTTDRHSPRPPQPVAEPHKPKLAA
jgi:surface polysaccharide O-acyltransferase-like enzyme